MPPTVDELRAQLAATAAGVVASGAISPNGHGNLSLRAPGASEMLFSTAPTLRQLGEGDAARIALTGDVIEGDVPPINQAVIDMHAAIYNDLSEVGCVIHTHAPYATAFAVARRPIDCWIEALAMFGLGDGVPLARYGPRGSAEAVANIREAIRGGAPAVLLANHGILVFHRTPEQAVNVLGIVEEAARDAINAVALGGPVPIEPAMRAAALQRAAAFGIVEGR